MSRGDSGGEQGQLPSGGTGVTRTERTDANTPAPTAFATGTKGMQESSEDEDKPEPIRLTIPPRLLVLPAALGVTGLSIGLIRGARAAGWRFLAENAHRPPTTLQGWYYYKKTKNYKMMWGGLKEGGRDALKLGALGTVWAATEEGTRSAGERVGGAIGRRVADTRETAAGVVTAGLFAAVYRLPWLTARRVFLYGVVIGGMVNGLRWGQERLRKEAESLRGLELEKNSETRT